MNKNYKVYIHLNKQNGKAYVGITNRTNPQFRWGSAGQGYQKQPKFYNAIEKYGWDSFEHFTILEGLSKSEALDLETYYIEQYDSINNGYNILLHGINSYPRHKPVYCVTTGRHYNSIKEASEDTHTLPSRIIQNCKGQIGPTKGLQWTYWDSNNDKPCPVILFKPKARKTTAIYCIEEKTFFDSVEAGAQYIGVDSSDLSKVLCKKRNGIQGLHFIKVSELTEENLLAEIRKQTGRTQKVYCHETQIVYDSLEKAACASDRTAQTVMKNCQRKLQSCGGLHFSYLKDVDDEILLSLYYPNNQGGFVEDE